VLRKGWDFAAVLLFLDTFVVPEHRLSQVKLHLTIFRAMDLFCKRIPATISCKLEGQG
jgi:hypothetical protein